MKKRQFTILPGDVNTAIIPLTQGKIAFVDTVDAERLCKYNWSATKGKCNTWYATTCVTRNKFIKMHRFILDPEDKNILFIDHKDKDGLNNRKSNLRFATYSQNCQNKKDAYEGLGSGYRGVSLTQWGYVAKIQHRKNQMYLGCFKTKEEAARAYDAKAVELFGEFSCLNNPN